ncbi:MAG: anti-CBASS protein Acb1 family protein [Intestinimonas sp.]
MTDNYALLNSLYRDNWVVQNVVGIIPDDMTKKWFAPAGAVGPEHLKELDRVQRVTALRERVNEGLRWGRLYGGAAGLIMIRGQEGMLGQPLELESIYPGTFQGLYILDRWQGVVPGMELVFEGGEPVPAYYSITDARGNTVAKVHHSRLVRFTGRDLPFLERVAELYWGESEVEALYNDVVKHDNVAANMAQRSPSGPTWTPWRCRTRTQLFSVTSGEQREAVLECDAGPKRDEVQFRHAVGQPG